jgi:hypothetical protein
VTHSPGRGTRAVTSRGQTRTDLHSEREESECTEKDGEGVVVGRLEDATQLHHVVAQQRTLLIDVSCGKKKEMLIN